MTSTETRYSFVINYSFIPHYEHDDSLYTGHQYTTTLEQALIISHIAALIRPWYDIAWCFYNYSIDIGYNPRFREIVSKIASALGFPTDPDDNIDVDDGLDGLLYDLESSSDGFVDILQSDVTLDDLKDLYHFITSPAFISYSSERFDFTSTITIIDQHTLQTIYNLDYSFNI